MIVPMMGDMLEISIARPTGIQHIILSSRFDRAGFPPFYGGDADIAAARPLLKFLSEHMENNTAGILDHPNATAAAKHPRATKQSSPPDRSRASR